MKSHAEDPLILGANAINKGVPTSNTANVSGYGQFTQHSAGPTAM